MDGIEEDPWSAVADEWDRWWGDAASPAGLVAVEVAGLRAGQRVLDVGCGSGHLLARLSTAGFVVAGADPAAGMMLRARGRVPGADLRSAPVESLPWEDGGFDLTLAVNALQLADDPLDGLREMVRVTAAGGHVAVVGWAERELNDLDVVESAVARADGEELPEDGDLRRPGGLQGLLADGGLRDVEERLVEVPWVVADDEALVRGILLGEEPVVVASYARTVLEAARPLRRADGSYRLVNHVRLAVGCTASGSR